MKRHITWLIFWGVAFGMIEAAVVIYLRQIYYPNGFAFPIIMADFDVAVVELIRELATLVLMWSLAALLYKKIINRIAVFMFVFGVWDIFYYVFLKLFLGWPAGLATWDILFLLPYPWVGPVWAPVLVSIALIYASIRILKAYFDERIITLQRRDWLQILAAGVVIIISFLIPGKHVIDQTIPQHYPWYILVAGLIWGLAVFHNRLNRQVDNVTEKGV
ncbi:MAG: hypothetical protein K9N11_09400 [Lentisphaeria bacterium]|nr:hypothetical protein [Candidatus Neomarinimicrobiota bacterium]MCF7843052.1 hypothetical protein [Lentisphaeria bacterium]